VAIANAMCNLTVCQWQVLICTLLTPRHLEREHGSYGRVGSPANRTAACACARCCIVTARWQYPWVVDKAHEVAGATNDRQDEGLVVVVIVVARLRMQGRKSSGDAERNRARSASSTPTKRAIQGGAK
jgi:hypothetical protein